MLVKHLQSNKVGSLIQLNRGGWEAFLADQPLKVVCCEAVQLVVLAQYRSRAHDEQVVRRRDGIGLLFGDNAGLNEHQVMTTELFSFY